MGGPLSYSLPGNVDGHGLLKGGDGVPDSFPNGSDEAPTTIRQGRNGSSNALVQARLGVRLWSGSIFIL